MGAERMLEMIQKIFPEPVRRIFPALEQMGTLEEIRVRAGQPFLFQAGETEYFLDEKHGKLTRERGLACVAKKEDLAQMLLLLSRYSLYAFEEEIRRGYITLEGGHRVGLAGQTVLEDGKVRTLRYINFMNIRIARERKGCAAGMVPYLYHGDQIYNTLIFSPPGMGKTTYLRDAVRLLSDGGAGKKGLRVCVLDERSEIAACHLGIPQNDVGMRTDVMDGCTKAEGMQMVLRSMAPQVIAVDELGCEEDFEAVEKVLYSGSRILGTVHAENMDELEKKSVLRRWKKDMVFERLVRLGKKEDRERYFEIFDGSGKRLC